jgi:hypothetical protein
VEILGGLPRHPTGKISMPMLRGILSGTLSDDIFSSLARWRHGRAPPSDPDGIRMRIQASLRSGRPLELLAYWGCGLRSAWSEKDQVALDRLVALRESARRQPHTQPRLQLIFTDIHASNNAIPCERIEHYLGAVTAAASPLGVTVLRLSELWEAGRLSLAAVARESCGQAFQERWGALEHRSQMIEQAEKHYEGGRDPEAAARAYFLACQHDSALIADRYPGALFTTYNAPKFDFLLPPLPKLYLYSYKDGTSIKPWFTGT